MAHSKKRKTLRRFNIKNPKYVLGSLCVLAIFLAGANHFVRANSAPATADVMFANEDPNFHVKSIATQFFEDNDAGEMIPIIRCESHFKQFAPDGTVLQNSSGSNAIGVAQIMSSQHPDPKIIKRYNREFDMDMSVEDFDLNTLEGNLGYALVLYKVRGVRDWECSQKFRF